MCTNGNCNAGILKPVSWTAIHHVELLHKHDLGTDSMKVNRVGDAKALEFHP